MKAVMSSFRPVRSSGCGDIFSASLYGSASQVSGGGQQRQVADVNWQVKARGLLMRAAWHDLNGAPARWQLRPCTCISVLNFSFTPQHALLQRICGLSGPRSRQETDRERSN